jgi:RNA polymerase sigma factor (sigma-70 family)
MTDSAQAPWSAFDRLYLEEHERIVRHLVYLTGERATAEDLAQETFSRLLERGGAGDADVLHNPRAWLTKVASNLAYNHFRGETRRGTREAAEARVTFAGRDASTVGASEHGDVDLVLDVRRALDELAPRDRAVLLLRHSGFSYAEIAEAVGLAPGSVGTTLARAQRRFRDVYEGRAVSESSAVRDEEGA